MQLRKIGIVSPARILFSVFCALLAAWFGIGWNFCLCSQIELDAKELSQWELTAQARSIERRLRMGEDEFLSLLIPEGTLFCNTLYGFALVNQAVKHPSIESDPSEDRTAKNNQKVCNKLEWLIKRVESLSSRHPFNLNSRLKPQGGIIIAGHANLLRAGYVLLGGTSASIRRDFDTDSKNIYDAFVTAKTAFPECYQGHTWAQDSVFALESLRLHDVLLGTNYSGACERWLAELKEHIDPKTGLMVAQIDPSTNKSIEGSRGCATAWGLVYLPQLGPDFSRAQYARFKRDWFVPFLGCTGIYEWDGGHETPTNFYAGPVILGLGAAASGIGIAASRANGDYESWHRLLRSLEFLGLPTITPTGEKSYFFGLSLLSDVVALWGKSMRRWDAPEKTSLLSAESSAPAPAAVQAQSVSPSKIDKYFIALLIATILSLCLTLLLSLRACKLVSCYSKGLLSTKILSAKEDVTAACTSVKPEWSKVTVVALVVQSICVLLFLVCPLFTWMQIVVFMAIVDLIEEMTIRPAIIGKLYNDN